MRTHGLIEQPTRRPAEARAARPARPWTLWLIPKPFDAVSSLLYLGVLALFFYERLQGLYSHPLIPGQGVLISGAVLALLLIDRGESWFYGAAPPVQIAAVLFAARVVLIECVAQLDDFSFSPFLYLLLPFTASLYFGMRVCYAVAGLVWLAYMAKIALYQVQWYSLQTDMHSVLIFAIGLIFAIAMAKVVASEKVSRARAESLLAELAASHRRLRAYAEQVEELAATQERNRLAREIHDSLGHYLTVINVQLEKALAFRGVEPAEADLAVADAKRLAHAALRDVRLSVGTLRAAPHAEPLTLGAALPALVENLRGGAFTLALAIQGEETGLPADARLALYRAAQEGLTNVQKHAGATAVWIDLDFAAATACLTVRDNGCGFDPAANLPGPGAAAGGFGLLGVRERLELIGGSVQVESRPGAGTLLRVCVPRDPPGAAPARLRSTDDLR